MAWEVISEHQISEKFLGAYPQTPIESACLCMLFWPGQCLALPLHFSLLRVCYNLPSVSHVAEIRLIRRQTQTSQVETDVSAWTRRTPLQDAFRFWVEYESCMTIMLAMTSPWRYSNIPNPLYIAVCAEGNITWIVEIFYNSGDIAFRVTFCSEMKSTIDDLDLHIWRLGLY